ncbi:MAG: YbaB/EbfC family nucleoid-associated protein [Verrucomicrobia bacterium]|nr:YbaB/EbfC family nucleoid-associated protein [Verrucomicrobiota bacterium]
MSSIGKLMKQAARIQRQMEEVQSQLTARTVDATSGGGAVKVVARCDGTLASVTIDPQAVNPAEAQLLEDLIVTAANQALTRAKEIYNEEMGRLTAGMNLPGVM